MFSILGPASSYRPGLAIRWPGRTIGIGLLCLILFLGGGDMFSLFVYDRSAIAGGEIWRLFTGHLLHSGWQHFVWDVGAFVFLGSMIERMGAKFFWSSMITSCAFVGAGLFFLMPELGLYLGLSGALNALFVIVCMRIWVKRRGFLMPLILIGGFIKIIAELIIGASFIVDTAFYPLPEAHLLGFVWGIAWCILPYVRQTLTYG